MNTIKVLFKAEYAFFANYECGPHMRTYDVPTPSALRGALSAIFWKPQMRIYPRLVEILNPIRKERFLINGLTVFSGCYIEERRTQKYWEMLKSVAYVVTAEIESINPAKYMPIFRRRIENGQCFKRPYLGTKECACEFYPAPRTGEYTPANIDMDIGYILYDVAYDGGDGGKSDDRDRKVFDAKIRNGLMKIPRLETQTMM